ncbi:MAG: right-handed parallel beta-helix repeat-containing protein, partial [Planctomycetota bacterium]
MILRCILDEPFRRAADPMCAKIDIKTMAVIGVVTAFAGTTARGDVIDVPAEHPTIQAAIDAAEPGDEIVLADGTYGGSGNVGLSFGGKDLTLRSASGDPMSCTIDGGAVSQFMIFDQGETAAAVVAGIRFVNGADFGQGGGSIRIAASSPTIENCRFEASFGDSRGGALFIDEAAPLIRGCVFTGGFSNGDGGVVYSTGAPVFEQCLFIDNFCFGVGGGAIHHGGSWTLTLTDCEFTDNWAGAGGTGGAVYVEGSIMAVGCVFQGNDAERGGAVHALYADATINSCTFENNVADSGGAIYNEENSPFVTNSSFIGNTAELSDFPAGGGAIYNEAVKAHFEACAFDGNEAAGDGGALRSTGDLVFNSCAFATNVAFRGGASYAQQSFLEWTECDFVGNGSQVNGGAVIHLQGEMIMSSSTFIDNTGGAGAGLLVFGFDTDLAVATLTDVRFLGNTSDDDGGGCRVFNGVVEFVNCLFSGNSAEGLGGGLHAFGPVSDVTLVNCSMANNTAGESGGGVHSSTLMAITNGAFQGDSPNAVAGGASTTVSYSCVDGGWAGAGVNNIDGSPLFTDADG